MKKAIWFSRHTPTQAQLDDAAQMGFEIIVTDEASEMAALSIETEEQVDRVVNFPEAQADRVVNFLRDSHCAVFGVFPPPVQERITLLTQSEIIDALDCEVSGEKRADWSPCFSAWNVTRSVEGGPATFTHHKWVLVGKV